MKVITDADDPGVVLVYPDIPADHITLTLQLNEDGTVETAPPEEKPKPKVKPKPVSVVLRAKKMTEQLYARNSVGCCLHTVTDDGNIEDRHVDFCVEYAEKAGHQQCHELAVVYQSMSMAERAQVLNLGWCPTCEGYSCCGQCHGCGGALVEPKTEMQ